MTALGKKTIGVSILVLLLGAVAGLKVLSGMTSDRYAGEPQVVVLPPGYDPLAIYNPYSGEHPSLGQPLVDNHDQAGTAIYDLDDTGNKSDRLARKAPSELRLIRTTLSLREVEFRNRKGK